MCRTPPAATAPEAARQACRNRAVPARQVGQVTRSCEPCHMLPAGCLGACRARGELVWSARSARRIVVATAVIGNSRLVSPASPGVTAGRSPGRSLTTSTWRSLGVSQRPNSVRPGPAVDDGHHDQDALPGRAREQAGGAGPRSVPCSPGVACTPSVPGSTVVAVGGHPAPRQFRPVRPSRARPSGTAYHSAPPWWACAWTPITTAWPTQ